MRVDILKTDKCARTPGAHGQHLHRHTVPGAASAILFALCALFATLSHAVRPVPSARRQRAPASPAAPP